MPNPPGAVAAAGAEGELPPGPRTAADDAARGEPVVLSLPPDLRSVSQARGRLEAAATGWGCSEQLIDDARVVLSELMSNGVLHARTDLQVVISARGGGGVRLEVRDASQTAPLPPLEPPRSSANLMDEPHPPFPVGTELTLPTATGRGLAVVSALGQFMGLVPRAWGRKSRVGRARDRARRRAGRRGPFGGPGGLPGAPGAVDRRPLTAHQSVRGPVRRPHP